MRNLDQLILNFLAITATVAFVEAGSRRATTTSFYSHATSTWNPLSRCIPRFGRRRATDSRYRSFNNPESNLFDDDWDSVLIEQKPTNGKLSASQSNNGPEFPQRESSSSDRAREQHEHLGAASARAFVVAFVSAAAIGSARHAFEFMCP